MPRCFSGPTGDPGDAIAYTWSDEDKLAAAAAAAIGLFLAIQYEAEYKESIDCWEDTTNRQQEMMRQLADCYCTVTYPQLDEALTCALNFNADVTSCTKFSEFTDCAAQMTEHYVDAELQYQSDYCLGKAPRCNNEWSHITAINAANANLTKWASQERRSESLLQEKIRAILRAKQATYLDPSPINQLMGTAAGIKSAMAGQAAQGLNGSVAAFGYGGSALFSTVGGLFS